MNAVLLVPFGTSWTDAVTHYLESSSESQPFGGGSSVQAPVLHFPPNCESSAERLCDVIGAAPVSFGAGNPNTNCRTEVFQGEDLSVGFLLLSTTTPSPIPEAFFMIAPDKVCTLPPTLDGVKIPSQYSMPPLSDECLAAAAMLSLQVQVVLPLTATDILGGPQRPLNDVQNLLKNLPWIAAAFPVESARSNCATTPWLLPDRKGVLLTTKVPMCIDSTALNQPVYLVVALSAFCEAESGTRNGASMRAAKHYLSRLRPGASISVLSDTSDICNLAGASVGCSRHLSLLYSRLFSAAVSTASKAAPPISPLAALLVSAAARGRREQTRRLIASRQQTAVVLGITPVVIISPIRLLRALCVSEQVFVELVNDLNDKSVSILSCSTPSLRFSYPLPAPVSLPPAAIVGLNVGCVTSTSLDFYNNSLNSMVEHAEPERLADLFKVYGGGEKTEEKNHQKQQSSSAVLPLNITWSLDGQSSSAVWARYTTEITFTPPAPLQAMFIPPATQAKLRGDMLYATAELKLTNSTKIPIDVTVRLTGAHETTTLSTELVPLQSSFPPCNVPPRETVTVEIPFYAVRLGCHKFPQLLLEIPDCPSLIMEPVDIMLV